MAISKVTLNGETLMDVTSDTVEASNLLSGNTATKNDGTKVTGSYTPSEPVLQEKTVTPTTSVQVITAGTETIEEHVGNEIYYQYSVLTITVNGETEGSIYKKATNNNAQFIPDLSKTYKVWFRIKKWYFSRMDEYEYGTPFECEAVGTFYSNGSNQDLIVPVSDPDGVITSLRVAIRQNATGLCLIPVFGGGASIPTYKNYIKYESKIYTVEEVTYDALSQVTVNPIPSEYVIPTGTLSVSQNGTVNVKNYEYASVNVEGGGGATADESLPVRFLDYDGTVVYSYTAEDFANLTALPSNPSHTGLTAQGWNWTLADAKEQVAEMGECDIGQMYITDDGKTRIYVELDEYTLHPYLSLGVNGTIEIDWGDGSSTDTLTGTSLTTAVYRNHEYSSSGKYIIKITVVSGTFSIFGTGNGSYLFRKGTTITKFANASYLNLITAVELGNNVNLGNYAFAYCYSLETITIPNGMSFGTYAFEYCYHLKAIMIPSGVTNLTQYICYSCRFMKAISIPLSIISIGTYAFEYAYGLHRIVLPISITSIGDYALTYCSGIKKIILPQCTNLSTNSLASCYSLQHVIIPDSIITIGASALQNDYSLSKLTIPSGVTSIGSLAFDACYSMKEYHILPTTPPTLASTNVFRNIQSDCKIYVPAESLEAYKTATNWSTYASYMVGE